MQQISSDLIPRKNATFESSLIALLAAMYYLVQSIASPVPGVYWGELMLLLCTGLSVVWHPSDTLRIHAVYVCFLILYLSFIGITLATACFQPAFSLYDFGIRAVRWAVYIGCGMILSTRINFRLLRKYVITIAVLVALLLIFQVLVHRLTGRVISVRIGRKVLGCSIEGRYVNGVRVSRIYRFSSVFSEPAHFAFYCIIGLILLVFYRRRTGRFTQGELGATIVLVVGLVMSTSTYGLGLLAIVGVIYLMRYLYRSGNSAYSALIVPAILLVLGAVYFGMQGTSTYDYLLGKVSNIGATNRTTFIWQGSFDFPRLMTWLGCGVGNEEYYFTHVFNYALPYVNSISTAFLYCGVVGLILLGMFFLVSWVFCDRNAKVFLVVLGSMALFSTMFFGPLISLIGTIMVAGAEQFDLLPGGEA